MTTPADMPAAVLTPTDRLGVGTELIRRAETTRDLFRTHRIPRRPRQVSPELEDAR